MVCVGKVFEEKGNDDFVIGRRCPGRQWPFVLQSAAAAKWRRATALAAATDVAVASDLLARAVLRGEG